MVNIRTRVATVNIAFSSSRNAALTVPKKLQYTTLSIKIHHGTLKIPKFLHYQTTLLVSQYIARIRNNTQVRSFLKKPVNITLKTCVDIANEFLQAYIRGGGS